MWKKLKRIFWLFGTVLFLLMIFLPGFSKLQELKEKQRDLEEKIRRLKVENALLEEELSKLQNDPLYQEKVARDKMGVVKRGEIPIKIIEQSKE